MSDHQQQVLLQICHSSSWSDSTRTQRWLWGGCDEHLECVSTAKLWLWNKIKCL